MYRLVEHRQNRNAKRAAASIDADEALAMLVEFDRMLVGAELTQDESSIELALN
jgi:hypothetical protein